MQTEKINTNEKLIMFPQGWKTATAKALGVHINTITNNLKKGSGDTYDKIIHTAKQIYQPNK